MKNDFFSNFTSSQVMISNKCDTKLLVNGQAVLTERPLFSNSLITISNKVRFRWFHCKVNDSIGSSGKLNRFCLDLFSWHNFRSQFLNFVDSSFASQPIDQSSYISEDNEEFVLSEDFSENDSAHRSNALITVRVKVEPADQIDQIPNDFYFKTPTHDQQSSNLPDANNNRVNDTYQKENETEPER